MEKRNVYKVKSVCVPHMGNDTLVRLDAQARERAYQDSLKTLARKAILHEGETVKAVYVKSENGNVSI